MPIFPGDKSPLYQATMVIMKFKIDGKIGFYVVKNRYEGPLAQSISIEELVAYKIKYGDKCLIGDTTKGIYDYYGFYIDTEAIKKGHLYNVEDLKKYNIEP